ncbi:hypothetical protein D3C71_2058090 [compost metagenome]
MDAAAHVAKSHHEFRHVLVVVAAGHQVTDHLALFGVLAVSVECARLVECDHVAYLGVYCVGESIMRPLNTTWQVFFVAFYLSPMMA